MRIAVIGGGFSGSVAALRLAACPDRNLDVTLIEPRTWLGAGLAYGTAAPWHLLNVPVNRMEPGLEPSFFDWLADQPEVSHNRREALVEAYVPRLLFGRYLAERVQDALIAGRLRILRARVADIEETADGLRLLTEDGRALDADRALLALGNAPPRPPALKDAWISETAYFRNDPWERAALDGLAGDEPILLLGAGLTMVDMALSLAARGHTGPMLALSRRGLLPRPHRAGGAWNFAAEPCPQAGAVALLRWVRQEVRAAERAGMPWQRVFDAIRPRVAAIWQELSEPERARLLRHGRPWWDAHRYRMAGGVAALIDQLIASGRLTVRAARVRSIEIQGARAVVTYRCRPNGATGEATDRFAAARIINCTGPAADPVAGHPLLARLNERALVRVDRFRQGLETEGCALIGHDGAASDRLYAIGPLTRPAFWEITGVPEIRAQIDWLATHLIADATLAARDGRSAAHAISQAFLDLGAGI